MARAILILQVSFLQLLTVVYGGFMNDLAVISPVDKLVFVGETLKIKCQLKSSAVNISSLDMYINISYCSNSIPWLVPQENITIADNKTIFALIKITDGCSWYATIVCIAKNKILSSKGLYVERPIRNITNFSGVYFYENQNILTTWSLGEKYLDSVNVDIDWNSNLPPNISGNSCSSSTKESCILEYLSQDVFFFRIRVWIRADKRPTEEYLIPLYDTEATSVHMFVPMDNLKIGPPQSLTVIDKSSMCVNISWKISEYFKNFYLHNETIYRFELKMEDEAEFRVAEDNVTLHQTQEFMMLCQLIPYRKYILGMRTKVWMVNPWSDQVITEFLTEEDRPLTGPPVIDTSYHTEECLKRERNFILYWNDPPKSSLRGELTRYELVRDNNTQLMRAGSNYYLANLDCDSFYEIYLYSVTKVGPSLIPSSITIPKESDELMVENDLTFRVEDTSQASAGKATMNMTVTWVSEDLAKDTSLILYMCQEAAYPKTCVNDFTTIEINVHQRNIVLNDIPLTTNLFGYSLINKNGQKRGIKWTNCIYRADLKPAQPTELTVNPGSQANSLLISWTSTQCSKTTKVLVLQYHIYICLQFINDVSLLDKTCQSVIISNLSITSYVAKDLKGSHSFYVYIQAESPAGLGPLSKPVVGYPMSPTSSDNAMEIYLGAILGTVTGVFLLGLLIFILARFCRRAGQRVKILYMDFEWPSISDDANERWDQDKNESGIYTGSDQNSTEEEKIQVKSDPSVERVNSNPSAVLDYIRCGLDEPLDSPRIPSQEFIQPVHKPGGDDSNPSTAGYIRRGLDEPLDSPHIPSQEFIQPVHKPGGDDSKPK